MFNFFSDSELNLSTAPVTVVSLNQICNADGSCLKKCASKSEFCLSFNHVLMSLSKVMQRDDFPLFDRSSYRHLRKASFYDHSDATSRMAL